MNTSPLAPAASDEPPIQLIIIDQHGMEIVQRLRACTRLTLAYVFLNSADSPDGFSQAIHDGPLLFILADASNPAALQCARAVGQYARQRNMLSIAPLSYRNSDWTIDQALTAAKGMLAQQVDALLEPCLPPDWLHSAQPAALLQRVNALAGDAIYAISSSHCISGLVNLDLHDLRDILARRKMVKVTAAIGQGAERAEQSAQSALTTLQLTPAYFSDEITQFLHFAATPQLKLSEISAAITCFEPAIVIVASQPGDLPETQLRLTVFAVAQ